MRKYRPIELLPGPGYASNEELAKAAGEVGTTNFLPVGTCKIGPATDRHAAVEAELRVHRIGGLRVVDSAIMPVITSGNTCSPTILIAEKAALIIRAAAAA